VLNEGDVITNENHRILFANSRFVEMTGIPKQGLIGSDPSQFYSPQELDFVAQQIDVALRAGHNRLLLFSRERAVAGCPIISSRRLENSGSNFGIVTFTDISEQNSIGIGTKGAGHLAELFPHFSWLIALPSARMVSLHRKLVCAPCC
jgi:PAS domain S-box-containing protein